MGCSGSQEWIGMGSFLVISHFITAVQSLCDYPWLRALKRGLLLPLACKMMRLDQPLSLELGTTQAGLLLSGTGLSNRS